VYTTEWPRSFKPLIGEHALSMTNGPKHKYLRALVANPLSLENLKTYVPLIEKAVLALLDSWQDNIVLGAHQEMRRVRATTVTAYTEPNLVQDAVI
jgi:cytochrome P450